MIKTEHLTNQLQFARQKKVYLVSELLKNDYPEGLQASHQALLYQNLEISMFEWNQDEPSEEVQMLKNVLEKFEAFCDEPNSVFSNFEFDALLEEDYFGEFDQIPLAISEAINKPFNFSIVKNKNPQFVSDFKEKIRNFYNFLMSSNIVSKDNLLKILYHVGIIKEGDFEVAKGMAMALTRPVMYQDDNMATAMIAIDFNKHWTNLPFAELRYKEGEITSNSFFGTFVHEFAHVISAFYSLSPDLKEVLNLNIQDDDPSSEDDNSLQKIDAHFKKINQREKNIEINVVVDDCVNKMLKNLLSDEEFDNSNIFQFALWTLVPSYYGRTISAIGPNHSKYLEWYAEGFAYWFMTPEDDRNKIWEFWHEYFVNEFKW